MANMNMNAADAAAPSMFISISDRRVTDIPVELESKLCLEPYCHTCNANAVTSSEKQKSLKRCSSCKLVYYCSRDCQQLDWRRHKSEDECPVSCHQEASPTTRPSRKGYSISPRGADPPLFINVWPTRSIWGTIH